MAQRKRSRAAVRGVVTVMFTDIVNSAGLKQAMDGETSASRDAVYLDRVKTPHDAVVMRCVEEAGGHKVNCTGDGFCCTFSDAEAAVRCAARIQRRLSDEPIRTPLGALQVRIGLHTGHLEELADCEPAGSSLDTASRVQLQAAGGEVLTTRETQVLVSRRLRGVTFEDVGVRQLKGLGEVALYRVVRSENEGEAEPAAAPLAAPRFVNPYNFSGTATRTTFKGRENELDELVDSVEGGTH